MNPYANLPTRAFWKTAVAGRDARRIKDLWIPKFTIQKTDAIATLGSCFAQHISRALIAAGYNWQNAEPAPPKLPSAERRRFNYEIFSVRTGNIYTVAALRQWVQWSLTGAAPPREVWRDGDRVYDPFRPAIEPSGFASEDEMLALRQQTVSAMRSLFQESSIFIFTLGLTEAWINTSGGYVYPLCPGTLAGKFDPKAHRFHNYTFAEIYHDLTEVIRAIRAINPSIRILLTVSPVPLTATAGGEHILIATSHSKSILRAVASTIVSENDFADYFPSYEIISSFPFLAQFYDTNLRSVTEAGVAHVMQTFFGALSDTDLGTLTEACSMADSGEKPVSYTGPQEESDVVCEEMMLSRYGE